MPVALKTGVNTAYVGLLFRI